ncbi:MAG: group II intron reverse transcriptase/maturase [Hormoscilla sp. GUM202]|nr:group II intron reverse transcriptase/maturase [Hormoscilla sp. GUM202]MBO1350335.1 group II intron reverse transcriptase/maturase [Hormoscilla sp. GUM202]
MNEWRAVPWRKLERKVFKLQKRIYRAAQRGDKRTVRKLQRLLSKSWSAKCLAVRRVTQDNQGKNTAGVDGVKTLTPEQRLELVRELKVGNKAKPARRVWIPKPGKTEKRPLGIPVMYDRALQGLVKSALEPEWEAYFEANSYGFRPGRGCHDAIGAIFSSINQKAKWVLDADIAKCFDRIDHKALLEKLNTLPIIRRQIRAWLKAGVIDGKEMFETTEGTPQGGVISPLLANVALHGLEEKVKSLAGNNVVKRQNLTVVRYADDFVVMHKDKEMVEMAQKVIADWLRGIGLELKHEKTQITHTLKGENPGFNFLGFNVRQYEIGKYYTGKNRHGKPLGFKTLIKPSKESIGRHKERLSSVVKEHRNAPLAALISKLNPIIRGWSNYFRTVVSKETYSDMDSYLWETLWNWAKRRHPNKSKHWIAKKYWSIGQDRQWRFWCKTKEGEMVLLRHSNVEIVRHTKVKGEASAYDGNLAYWSTRLGKNPELNQRVAKLLKKQKGKCLECGLTFMNEDKWEVDHIKPLSLGGKDWWNKIQLLHKHCHDRKTARDGSCRIHDKDGLIEEPDEVKVSCPVLKTSRRGDSQA